MCRGGEKHKRERNSGPAAQRRVNANKFFIQTENFMVKKLQLIPIASGDDLGAAPDGLGPHGLALWRKVTGEFDFSDTAGATTLEQAARSLDRAESCREQINRDGELIKVRGGMKEHPLLRHELANRAFCVRALKNWV
jgi:hypothetical protein